MSNFWWGLFSCNLHFETASLAESLKLQLCLYGVDHGNALGSDFPVAFLQVQQRLAPNAQPEKALIDNIQLTSGYTDADGGYQAMDVMAEAIQSQPEVAVKDAWGAGFSIGTDGTLVVPTT